MTRPPESHKSPKIGIPIRQEAAPNPPFPAKPITAPAPVYRSSQWVILGIFTVDYLPICSPPTTPRDRAGRAPRLSKTVRMIRGLLFDRVGVSRVEQAVMELSKSLRIGADIEVFEKAAASSRT
jgi:hypothetical protein